MAALDPPVGYTIRIATFDDAHAIAELENTVNVAEVGFVWTSADRVHDELTAPGRDPDDDVVVVADDGRIVGYLTLSPDDGSVIHQLAFVHPTLWGTGMSTFLLRLGEERAIGRSSLLRVARWSTNEAAASVFTALGYRYVRTFRTLRVELAEEPAPVSEPPSGISIRTFDRARDTLAVHAALAEAFEDHWGSFAFPPYGRWVREAIEGAASGFDPRLWFVAIDGDQVVGALCARHGTARDAGIGQVDHLGVRRPWRGRGIGRALLLTAFAALAEREVATVELVVDSDSPTGANLLYASVGMRTAYAFELWQKEL
jgi:mycothiol synthase